MNSSLLDAAVQVLTVLPEACAPTAIMCVFGGRAPEVPREVTGASRLLMAVMDYYRYINIA